MAAIVSPAAPGLPDKLTPMHRRRPHPEFLEEARTIVREKAYVPRVDFQRGSAITGVSVPSLKAQYKRVMKPYGWRPTSGGQVAAFFGLLLNLAVTFLNWVSLRVSTATKSTGDALTSHWTIVSPNPPAALLLLSLLSVILVFGGIIWTFTGMHDRVIGYVSQMLARTREQLCPSCDCSLASVVSVGMGLIECPDCRDTFAESDIRLVVGLAS